MVRTHICRWAKSSKMQENLFCCSQKEQGSCSISWPMFTVHLCCWHHSHKLPLCSLFPKQSHVQENPRIQLPIQIKPYFSKVFYKPFRLCVRRAMPRARRAVCRRESFGFNTNTFTCQQNTQIIYSVIFHRKKQIARMSVQRTSSSGSAVHSWEMTDRKISSAVRSWMLWCQAQTWVLLLFMVFFSCHY